MDFIYLDNAATTKTSEVVERAIERAQRELYFNSAALYNPSLEVRRAIDKANQIIKNRLTRSGGGDLIFTSGATESNNMVMLGKITNTRARLLVLAGEHSSVYAPSVHLKNNGFDVDYVPLLPTGEIDLQALRRLVTPDTALFVFGMVNSDTGTLQNAEEIVRVVKSVNSRTHVHCDAVQGFAKFPFDVAALGLDSCAISAHKIYGPKGIGALWLRKGITLKPLMFGGAQQEYRPGTENNSAIIGFATAVESFDTARFHHHISTLHNHLVKELSSLNCTVNGNNLNPYITNVQLPKGILGQTVLNALSARGIAVGLGSACASNASKNRTLLAMGIPDARTKQVLRVSFGIYNTTNDVDTFIKELREILAKL
jgi:cysteine desulfurase